MKITVVEEYRGLWIAKDEGTLCVGWGESLSEALQELAEKYEALIIEK
jgi:hypothetical protein